MPRKYSEQEKNDVLGTAIPKVICPVCGKEHDYNGIIINKRLNHAQAEKIRSMHGQVIGLDDKACDLCMKRREEVIFALCVKKDEKSGQMVPDGRRMEIKRTPDNIGRFLERDDVRKFEEEHGFFYMFLGDEEQQQFDRMLAKQNAEKK